jgi:hypothetical protein
MGNRPRSNDCPALSVEYAFHPKLGYWIGLINAALSRFRRGRADAFSFQPSSGGNQRVVFGRWGRDYLPCPRTRRSIRQPNSLHPASARKGDGVRLEELENVRHKPSRSIIEAAIERVLLPTSAPPLKELFENRDQNADTQGKLEIKNLVRGSSTRHKGVDNAVVKHARREIRD